MLRVSSVAASFLLSSEVFLLLIGIYQLVLYRALVLVCQKNT